MQLLELVSVGIRSFLILVKSVTDFLSRVGTFVILSLASFCSGVRREAAALLKQKTNDDDDDAPLLLLALVSLFLWLATNFLWST